MISHFKNHFQSKSFQNVWSLMMAYSNPVFVECNTDPLDYGREVRLDSEISIGWRNLRYQTNSMCGVNKSILHRLNGHFCYHTLNALMGPSGAGKTTLLNCLTGNIQNGLSSDSEIYLNQMEKSLVSYFIEQHVHETIVARMTVGETFRYAYRFKNCGQKSAKPMNEYICEIVRELMLDELVLGRHFQDCSGGEQKRIAIGQELMSLKKPSLMFIDEPTTGLDSNAALVVVKCLKALATNYKMTIIASIHLPNEETLNLFDKLYVMAKGGVCIYSGQPELLQQTIEEQIGLIPGTDQQPIEALLKVACNGIEDQQVITLADHCLKKEYEQLSTELNQLKRQPNGLPNTRRIINISHLMIQFIRLIHINLVSEFRQFASQFILFALYFVVLATIYKHEMVKPTGCYDLEEQESTCNNELKNNSLLSENFNYLSFSIMIIGILQMTTSAVLFSPLVKVFRNEHRNSKLQLKFDS